MTQVLLLYSHEPELSMYAGLDRSLRTALQSGAERPLIFYTEHLDLIRFADEEHRRTEADSLRVKYSNREIDLVVAASPPALEFVLSYGSGLFATTPIVFTSVGLGTVESLELGDNITGVAVQRDIGRTVDLALALHPDTAAVVIPAGSSELEWTWTSATRQSLARFERRVSFDFLNGLSMEAMRRRLSELPPRTIVLFTPLLYFDAEGQYLPPEDSLRLLAGTANAPIYGTDEVFLGDGIVGGLLYDLAVMGEVAGGIGRRILDGERPANIPIQVLDPHRPMFDARQLARWNVPTSRLPHGSAVLFDEPGPWQRYRAYILGAASLVALQAALIAGLLVSRARRRKAEDSLLISHRQVQDLAARLIAAQEEERTRIARDLHDDVGQRVASFSIALSNVKRRLAVGHAEVREDLSTLQQSTIQLANDLRLLSHELHPGLLDHLGLAEALRARCDELTQESDLRIALALDPDAARLSRDAALCLYRVAQEALRNVVRHARAREVRVSLTQSDGRVTLQISDDGQGFAADQARRDGLGLVSLAERVRMIGGTLSIDSAPGMGTVVSVTIESGAPSA